MRYRACQVLSDDREFVEFVKSNLVMPEAIAGQALREFGAGGQRFFAMNCATLPPIPNFESA